MLKFCSIPRAFSDPSSLTEKHPFRIERVYLKYETHPETIQRGFRKGSGLSGILSGSPPFREARGKLKYQSHSGIIPSSGFRKEKTLKYGLCMRTNFAETDWKSGGKSRSHTQNFVTTNGVSGYGTSGQWWVEVLKFSFCIWRLDMYIVWFVVWCAVGLWSQSFA